MVLKKIYKCLSITTFLAQIAIFPSPSFAEKDLERSNEQKRMYHEQKNEEASTGLIGQYFTDHQFQNLAFIQVGEKNILSNKEKIKVDTANVKSIRWIGNIKADETGEYVLSTSKNVNVIIQVNGQTIVNQTEEIQAIQLEKDTMYEMKIEQRIEEGKIEEIQLFWSKDRGEQTLIPEEQLVSPDFAKKTEVIEDEKALLSDQNFFESRQKRDTERKRMDTDKDGIPDVLEVKGYTFKNNAIVAWKDAYATKGYKKYVSNPRKARTAADPYTDFEKITGRMPAATKYDARDPLVAAYPSVSVGMERFHFSKNETVQEGASGTKSKTVTNSNTTTNSVDIGAKFGFNKDGFSFDFSPKYTRSWSSSTSIANTESESWSKQININLSERAYLNANIRYYNGGTASIYDLRPTSNFVLQNSGESIATVTASGNTIGNSLGPGATYPEKGKAPISLTQANEAGTVKISVNAENLDKIQDGREILNIETTQYRGQYGKITEDGKLVSGGEWGPIRTNIDAVSGALTLNIGSSKEILERRIAAKDSRDPEDKTPEITVKEAIKKAFDVTEKDGRMVYTDENGKDIVLEESAVNIITNENTKKEIEKQLANMQNKKIYDVKWKRGMEMTLYIPETYYDFENGKHHFSDIYTVNGGYTGTTHAMLEGNASPGYAVIKKNLKPYTSYTARAYVKTEKWANTEATFFVGELNAIGNGGRGAKIQGMVDGDVWQLVEFSFNTGANPEYFGNIGLKNHGSTRLYFDDISLTEWKMMENIEKSHAFKEWDTIYDDNAGKYKLQSVKLSKFPNQKVCYQLLFNDDTWEPILPDSSVVDQNGERTISFGTRSSAPGAENKIGVFAVDEKNPNLKVKVAEFGIVTERQIKDAHTLSSWILSQDGTYVDGLYFDNIDKNILSHITEYKVSINKGLQSEKRRYGMNDKNKLKINILEYNLGKGIAKDVKLKIWAVVQNKDILVYEGRSGR
ncbi:binary toxin-like calcium binding domain-containing protein [Bacillus cereus group sp. BfR-BA-01349]|uniref:binary toxin-like calcium binding domain-containing protein n=1 Tax=Bacillus cereus group sp. BfR-BA-01349 TaxID=2920312 RepID=UPI001F5B0055